MTDSEAFKYVHKVIQDECKKILGEYHPTGLMILKTYLALQGLDLRDCGEVFRQDRLVMRIDIENIAYDGEILDYKIYPLDALEYVSVVINLENLKEN